MKYLSLFSGIGGFEYGIQQSNKANKLECIGYSEIDKYARSIYEKHYPNHTRLGDATNIKTEELPDFDFLVGGFPCQAFSIAGQRRGFCDTRGTLFFEIARILEDKKPTYFLLENVKGLLSHDEGRTFQTILEVLSDLGYNVTWKIYNTKNYGLAQNRERIYIKGFLRGKCGGEVLSLGEVEKKINGEHEKLGIVRMNEKPEDMRDRQEYRVYSEEGVAPCLTASRSRDTNIMECTPKRATHTDGTYVPKIKTVGRINNGSHGYVYDVEGISSTLTATGHKDPTKILLRNNTKKGYVEAYCGDGVKLDQMNGGGRVKKETSPTITSDAHVGTVTDTFELRRLTPVECERLQGFPDNYTQTGVNGEQISDTQRYKCIGNAVSTNVITYIMNNWSMKL